MNRALYILSILILVAFSELRGQTVPVHSLSVLATDSQLEGIYSQMIQNFQTKGPDAVASGLLRALEDPGVLQSWQAALASTNVKILDVKVHPSQVRAVDWMNSRFSKMGIPNLQFRAQIHSELPDPSELPEDQIKTKKWIRYSAGPGVALAATYLGLPDTENISSAVDYALLVLPNVGVGVTTILLEFQFAHPKLNNHFWKKVWEFGGPITGRLTNIFVNFLYGMSLYGAGVGSSHIPELWGGTVVQFAHMPLEAATLSAFIGAIVFHLSNGQYQTDISHQQSRGNMTGVERYGLETEGVVINNGARVLNWALPSADWLGYLAQWGFFVVRTAPQLWRTYVVPNKVDRQIKTRLESSNSEWREDSSESQKNFINRLLFRSRRTLGCLFVLKKH